MIDPQSNSAYRTGLIGGLIGLVGGLFVTLPSLVSSGFAAPVLLMALPLVVCLVLIGAWFSTVVKISQFGSSPPASQSGSKANQSKLDSAA